MFESESDRNFHDNEILGISKSYFDMVEKGIVELVEEKNKIAYEIELLSNVNRRRKLKELLAKNLKLSHNRLYVIGTDTVEREVIVLDNDDIQLLINRRRQELQEIKKKISILVKTDG